MNDDDAWIESLAGRPGGGSAATQAEAALLRAAMRRWPAPAPVATPAVETLVERARTEGLFAARRRWCAGCAERWRRWRDSPTHWAGAGVALASLAVAWFVVEPLLVMPVDDGAVQRAREGVQLRRVADPAAARERLAARLATAGVTVHRYERLGRYGIDADLPQRPPPAVAALLRDEGLAQAGDGSLRVEFEEAR
jgi:hypothetical protein